MNVDALKTICGAIKYTMNRYNEQEIYSHDWEYFCLVSGLSRSTVYNIALTKDGFLLTTKGLSVKYIHHHIHEKRIVEVSPGTS
jgi:hypothetical protein